MAMSYPHQQNKVPRPAPPPEYAPQYSVTEVTMMDGTVHSFMTKASSNLAGHLAKEMGATGFLTLWNDTDCMCIQASQVKMFSMRQITKEQP
jgi:hypothetical protein